MIHGEFKWEHKFCSHSHTVVCIYGCVQVRKYIFHLCLFAHFIMLLYIYFPDKLQSFANSILEVSISICSDVIVI